MRVILRMLVLSVGLALLPACATAQILPPDMASAHPAMAGMPETPRPDPADFDIPVASDFCIAQMTALPDGSLAGRHQFFTLVKETAHGAGPAFQEALAAYGEGQVPDGTAMMDVVEAIANPVTRQAMPELTVAQTAYLIRFASECETALNGQIAALEATNPDLANGLYQQAMGEDALFLRATLLDALYRLSADSDPQHGATIAAYQRDLVAQRGDIEFAAFDAEIDEIEAMLSGDLGKRLTLSNEQVAESGDAGAVAAARASAEITSQAQREETQRRLAEMVEAMMRDYRTVDVSVGFP